MTHRKWWRWLIDPGFLMGKTDNYPTKMLLNFSNPKKAKVEEEKAGGDHPLKCL